MFMREIRPVANIVEKIGEVVERLTLPAREKRQLEAELLRCVQEWERELVRERAELLREEAHGNWLQRSWRPLVMLTFAIVILIGTFTDISILSDTSRFWDLLEIGLGGYVIGRSGEKMAEAVFKLKAKN